MTDETITKEAKTEHKRKRDGNADNDSADVPQESPKETSRKRRKKDEVSSDAKYSDTEAGNEDNDDVVKKNKSRKDKKSKEDGEEKKKRKKSRSKDNDNKDDTALEKPKGEKKRKRDSKAPSSSVFENAEEDTNLKEKAREGACYSLFFMYYKLKHQKLALLYAYKHQNTPSSWKFNKGHQNWIVKHYYDTEEVGF